TVPAPTPHDQTRYFRNSRVELRAAGFDPERARALGRAGREAVRKDFSMSGAAKALTELTAKAG
ncbi:MAG: hypothetical protein ABMA01_05340, partial [Chthoniobacteraceae bacterium]